MQRSIYLAKLIGPVFAAIGVGMLVNGVVYRLVIEEGLHSPVLIYLSGLMVLPAGIALVLAHNVWVGDWRLIITLLGWLGAIGGACRIVFPQVAITIGTSIYSHPQAPVIAGIAVLVLGAVLSYFGYQEFFGGRATGSRTRKRSRR
jgi:cytochrome bd-type quinol oxidase subunit 2